MFKKYACYLSICLLAAPFVACADEPLPPLETLPTPPAERPVEPQSPLQAVLISLPQSCAAIAAQLNGPALTQLQAFYEQQDWMPVWASDSARLPALHAQLQLLADDGLNPNRYPLPSAARAGWRVVRRHRHQPQLPAALQDLHYGRLRNRISNRCGMPRSPRDRQARNCWPSPYPACTTSPARSTARPQSGAVPQLAPLLRRATAQSVPQWQLSWQRAAAAPGDGR